MLSELVDHNGIFYTWFIQGQDRAVLTFRVDTYRRIDPLSKIVPEVAGENPGEQIHLRTEIPSHRIGSYARKKVYLSLLKSRCRRDNPTKAYCTSEE